MGLDNPALLHVRASLCDRIDAIVAELGDRPHARLCQQIDDVRRIAQDHGLAPVAHLARGIESALARGECRSVIRSYVEVLREAVGCDRLDSAAGEAFLAAIAVRFFGLTEGVDHSDRNNPLAFPPTRPHLLFSQ